MNTMCMIKCILFILPNNYFTIMIVGMCCTEYLINVWF